MVNQETLRVQRTQAALHLDALSHVTDSTTQLIAAMQPPEDEDSSVGGVRIAPHILDSQEPMEGDGDDLMDFSDSGSATPTKEIGQLDFPTLGEAASIKGKKTKNSIIEGWRDQTINDPATSSEWETAVSITDTETDFKYQGTGMTMIDWRRAILPGENGRVHLIPTDWDHRCFTRHPVDNYYHCPFTRCKYVFSHPFECSAQIKEALAKKFHSVSSQHVDDLKRHLTSGVHQGTDHTCLKCLRHFKTAYGLIAHMESNSERCRVKDTEHFGQILSVVSGGFLGVKGRNADGSIKISALSEEELRDQQVEQRTLLPYEDPSIDWGM